MEFLKSILHPGFVWAVIGLFLLLAELALPGLIVFFFGVGALLVGLTCWLTDITLNQQLLLFLISSICFLLALRKWLKGIFQGNAIDKPTSGKNLDSLAGQQVVVKEDIQAGRKGKVILNGTDWLAESDEELAAGDTAIIVSQSSLTLKVSKQA